jgi:hypothetical protein
MGIGPALAIPAVCKKAGVEIKDIDVFELNEAFASQAVYSIEACGLDINKVNPLGGAIAMGHRKCHHQLLFSPTHAHNTHTPHTRHNTSPLLSSSKLGAMESCAGCHVKYYVSEMG